MIPLGSVAALLRALADVLREARLTVAAVRGSWGGAGAAAYETRWLELTLDLVDARGERAVLRRRQRVRFRAGIGTVVRELVWGEGRQLGGYRATGARRLAVQPEGSRQAVLLAPRWPATAGDELTLSSRRTIHGGFRRHQEYCEVLLERPTGRLELTIRFPAERPPVTAHLVRGPHERVLRRLPVRYRADGRAVLRCRLRRPTPATLYSLRWSW